MTKQNVRCDACGCAFVPEPKTQREGEIELNTASSTVITAARHISCL